ncbi:MAG: SUMF1/EgtB/PvdO family nonheme iron enzyme [Desulfococcaceae bacterium]
MEMALRGPVPSRIRFGDRNRQTARRLEKSDPAISGPRGRPLRGRIGSARVLRGGAYNNNSDNLRCAYRNRNNPNNRNDNIGFRCVCAHNFSGLRKWHSATARCPRLKIGAIRSRLRLDPKTRQIGSARLLLRHLPRLRRASAASTSKMPAMNQQIPKEMIWNQSP